MTPNHHQLVDANPHETPRGLRCKDSRGETWIDAMAGRRGPLGYGLEPIEKALSRITPELLVTLPEVNSTNESIAVSMLRELVRFAGVRNCESILLTHSSDAAVEVAVLGARKLGSPSRYRTVALVGSDHGRTALCRTLSGRPELQQDLGPMIAGFAHIAVGDLDTLKRVVDEQTVAVVVSPLAIHEAAKLLDPAFLKKVREICDEAGAMLIADESKIAFGSCGAPLMIPAIAGIDVDAVVLSAGLLGGHSGGVLISSRELSEIGVSPDSSPIVVDALLEANLSLIPDADWLALAIEEHGKFAVELAELLSEFEFVQDIHANGATIGIELDVPASELIEAAAQEKLRLESAGEFAIWMQLPLVIEAADRDDLLSRFVNALQTTSRLASVSSI